MPRFYLDGFARDGLVAVFDREKNEIRRQQPINTAVIGHFYTLEDSDGQRRFELEELLSEYEGKAKPAIQKLVAGGDLSADERANLAIFVAFAGTRTPDMVNSVQQFIAGMITDRAKVMFRDVDEVLAGQRRAERERETPDEELLEMAKQIVEITKHDQFEVLADEKWAVRMAARMAMEIAPHIAGRDWRVVHRDNDEQSFVTTDAPVLLGSTVGPQQSVYGVGFASADAFVSFPLDQSSLLQMYGESGAFEHVEVGRDYVRRANLALARNCQRFVIGRDEELVRSLADRLGLASRPWRPKFSSA